MFTCESIIMNMPKCSFSFFDFTLNDLKHKMKATETKSVGGL